MTLTVEIYDGRTAFWQFDRSQKIKLTDVEAGTEVHFAFNDSNTALVLMSYAEGEDVLCNVPDVLLQKNGILNVYVYACDKTVKRAMLSVLPRPKPEDYVYDDYRGLIKRMEELENSGMTGLSAGENIKIENGIISVMTTDDVEQDNTLPLTSAGAYVVIGNIESLLSII